MAIHYALCAVFFTLLKITLSMIYRSFSTLPLLLPIDAEAVPENRTISFDESSSTPLHVFVALNYAQSEARRLELNADIRGNDGLLTRVVDAL